MTTPDPARVKRGRNAKLRGKADERDVARIIGGRRHPADTGGCEDVEHPELCVQVKGGGAVVTETMRTALQSAHAGAGGTGKLAAVVLVDRRGTRLQRWICFDLQEWADWHGYGKEETSD